VSEKESWSSADAPERELSPEDAEFLDRLAGWLAERRLATAAVLFLESVKPMNFVGSQAMFFFEPMVKAFLTGEGYTRFARIMERRENVERFLERIEAADAQQQERERKSDRADRESDE
jgi:hypothetical protein